MLNCKEVSELLSQSLDNDLSFMQRMGLSMHLFMCRNCANFKKQLLFMKKYIKNLGFDLGLGLKQEDVGLSAESIVKIKESISK